MRITRDSLHKLFTYQRPFGTQPDRFKAISQAIQHAAEVGMDCTPPSEEQTLAVRRLLEARMLFNQAIAVNEEPEPPAAAPEPPIVGPETAGEIHARPAGALQALAMSFRDSPASSGGAAVVVPTNAAGGTAVDNAGLAAGAGSSPRPALSLSEDPFPPCADCGHPVVDAGAGADNHTGHAHYTDQDGVTLLVGGCFAVIAPEPDAVLQIPRLCPCNEYKAPEGTVQPATALSTAEETEDDARPF